MQAAAESVALPAGWDESEQEMIDAFFKESILKVIHKACSAADCTVFAKALMGSDDIVLVNNQGFTSYTLMCPTRRKIIQFRLNELETRSLDLAIADLWRFGS